MKYKIVLIEDRFENHNIEKSVLSNIDADIIEAGSFVNSPEKLKEICKDADALLVNLYKIDENFITILENCKAIGRYGIGYDNIDIKAAAAKGIKVVNIPEYCTEEVAEHILALLFSVVRNITVKDSSVRNREWNIKPAVPVHRMSGKVFGIIGYGKIAKCLHKKLSCLGFSEILVYDRSADKKAEILKENAGKSSASFVSIEKLIQLSDYISINLPLTDETKHIIGKKELEQMKETSILINTSRGALVDTEALIYALNNKIIAGAGLDVFESEPLDKNSLLFSIKNAVLTDHSAWHSVESQHNLQKFCAENVLAVLTGKPCSSIVN